MQKRETEHSPTTIVLPNGLHCFQHFPGLVAEMSQAAESNHVQQGKPKCVKEQTTLMSEWGRWEQGCLVCSVIYYIFISSRQ